MKIRGNTIVTPVPKDVFSAEYDYETKELFSNFGKMCTAFLEGKIVTLSTTDPMGVKNTYCCTYYAPEEMSGYESSCLIFTKVGATYTETLYVTDNGIVNEHTISIGGGESNVFNVVYSNDLGSILCDFADIKKAYHEGKIIRFRYVLDDQDYLDYYLSYYFDNGEGEEYMDFIGGDQRSIDILRLSRDGSWTIKNGKLVSEGEYDELLSRIQTCEEYLGISGGGAGEGGDIYINGTPYWIDYPMTFEDMCGFMNSVSFATCPACGSDFSHISIDYENDRVLWRDDCGESGDNIAYLTQYGASVYPHQTATPGDSFDIVYENYGPGPGSGEDYGDYITIDDSMTYSIVSGMTFRQMISDQMFLNQCSECVDNMYSAFVVGDDDRVYFHTTCGPCLPAMPEYLTHYTSNEPVSPDEPISSGARFNTVSDE